MEVVVSRIVGNVVAGAAITVLGCIYIDVPDIIVGLGTIVGAATAGAASTDEVGCMYMDGVD